ncbi:universal stress protein [Salinadaptatus halalkaliphilus]|uniref:Universal stress protein n=1 Tax=Salinadaptatus halalkaliphilus TaxID=2419781 RepID=A0A4S3TP05_9EURY|nr:universal stress protein [Salinadaptatus halalkaliphilus]THE64308.1 universal stress protein [Salinadaptatus halalkaliphilus]
MFSTILVPVDGSSASADAFECAVSLAHATGAAVRAMFVVEPFEYDLGGEDDPTRSAARQRGRETLSAVVESATDTDLTVDRDVREGVPYREIVTLARTTADLIVMGTHGPTAKQGLGSTTRRVLDTADTPVLTVPADASIPDDGPDRILVATDGSESASRTADHALELVANVGSAVDVLHVVDETNPALNDSSLPMVELAREGGHDLVEPIRTAARGRDLSVTTAVTCGVPGRVIHSRANDIGAEIIAIGTHGCTTSADQLLGGTAMRVLRQTDRPVLLCR